MDDYFGVLILFVLILSGPVTTLSIILGGSLMENEIRELGCSDLEQWIIDARSSWEYAKVLHDLRCVVDFHHQGNQDDMDFTEGDYDVNVDDEGGNENGDDVKRNGNGVTDGGGRANP